MNALAIPLTVTLVHWDSWQQVNSAGRYHSFNVLAVVSPRARIVRIDSIEPVQNMPREEKAAFRAAIIQVVKNELNLHDVEVIISKGVI
jgi:hypothetical protein